MNAMRITARIMINGIIIEKFKIKNYFLGGSCLSNQETVV
jgi:hypothetical protein